MRWPLSRKRDFSLYCYMFVKYEGWTCPSMSLDAKHDMWTYLVWISVKWKYWNDPCRENEMLAYVVRSLINSKLVPPCPWCETWYVNLFGFIFGKMKVLEWLCRENEILAYMARSLIKVELVPRSPLIRNMICEPIWFCIRQNEIIWMTIFPKMRF
jgi:hypothetical protein